MKYQEPGFVNRAAATVILERGTDEEIQEAMVGLAFHDPDWRWVQGQCLRMTSHPSWSVRAIAATCLGHIARIHRVLDLEAVLPELERLRRDPLTTQFVDDALSDIRQYIR